MSTTKDLTIGVLSGADKAETDKMFSDIMKSKLESALEAKRAAIATKIYTKQEA